MKRPTGFYLLLYGTPTVAIVCYVLYGVIWTLGNSLTPERIAGERIGMFIGFGFPIVVVAIVIGIAAAYFVFPSNDRGK